MKTNDSQKIRLEPDDHKEAVRHLQQFFRETREEEISDFQATALLAGSEIKYQAALDIPSGDNSSSLPPALPVAGIIAALPVVWMLRKHFTPRNLRIFSNLLVITIFFTANFRQVTR